MQQLNNRRRVSQNPSFDTAGELPKTAKKVESGENSEQADVLEKLAQARRDLNDVIQALSLLGMERCTHCRKFFNLSNPGNFFGKNELVCYGCIPEWWTSRSGEIDVGRREKLETMLASWLRSFHGARIVKEQQGKMPEIASTEFRIVVHCNECGGSGSMLGDERCRFCNGFGTVWIVSAR